MEATHMELKSFISTAVLFLALAVVAPVFAQEQHDQDDKSKPAAQEEKKAQPEKSTKQEEKPAAQEDKNVKPEEKNAKQENQTVKPEERNAKQENQNAMPAQKTEQRSVGNTGGGRIPQERYQASFGQQHTFHVSEGDYRNHSFQYGGYSFGFAGAWPSNWLYTQDVYVVEINGVYYLCNPMYPGVNIALSFTP
jgi:hypothetical protein